MTKASRETLLTVLYILFGLLAALAVGLIWKGSKLTENQQWFMGLVVVGFSGALVYASVRLRGLGFVIVMIVLMFFGQLALSGRVRAETALTAAAWALPIGIAFALSGYVFKSLDRIVFGKFLLMAVFIGVAYGITSGVFLFISQKPLIPRYVIGSIQMGALFGALLGVGMEIVDLIGRAVRAEIRPDID